MSKSDLKAAMASLQVKKPLKLSNDTPVFKAPPQATYKSIPKVRSQERNQTQENPASLDAPLSVDDEPSMDCPITPDEKLSQGSTHSESQESLVPRSSQPRKATAQDSAVIESSSVKNKLSTGYTRVPNSILMEMVSGDLSRNEIRILLLVARMTISFNRPMVPLSKGVIERMTGIQGRAILEAIQSLEKAGLIRKVAGDHNSPNRLGLVFEDNFGAQKAGGNESSVAKASQDQNVPKPRDAFEPRRPGENSPLIKNNPETISIRKENSLSFGGKVLKNYFSGLKPERKRDAERRAFRELQKEFTDAQIEQCLSFLLEHGLPDSKAVCHSPMAYLSVAMNQVLQHVSELEKRRDLAELHARQREESARLQQVEFEKEEREKTERESAFQSAFPSEEEQLKVLERYTSMFPLLGRNGPLLRSLAIGAWWSEVGSRRV